MTLGVWLLVTPNTFGFIDRPLIVSNWVSGLLLIIFGDLARRRPRAIWIWSIAAVGIWLQMTPLIFWAPQAVAYLNDTFVGSLAVLFSLLFFRLPGMLLDEEPYVPPGWSFNPSAWPTRIFIGCLAFTCWMISRYLAAYQLGYIETIWDPFFSPGTKAVLESRISRAFPVPDAGLGAMAYTLEVFSVFLGGENRWRTAPWAVLIFGILVIPVSLTSIILIILQPLAVGTWCTLCLVTAGCMLISVPFAIGEVAATLQYLKASREAPFFSILFRGGLCPNATNGPASVSLSSSFLSLWKAVRCGVTFPWNLITTVFVGVALMMAPEFFQITGIVKDLDLIAGALAVVVSVIAMAEIVRSARYVNCLLGIAICLQLFWVQTTPMAYIYHIVAGVFLVAFNFRKLYRT